VTEVGGTTPELSGTSSVRGTGGPIGSPAARPISITVGTPLASTIIGPWWVTAVRSSQSTGTADSRRAPASSSDPSEATHDWVSSLSGK